MIETLLSEEDFHVRVTAFAATILLLIILCISARTKKWPVLDDILLSMVSVAGVSTGLKVILLTVFASRQALGPIANDRLALLLGGIVLLMFAAQAGARSFRRASNY